MCRGVRLGEKLKVIHFGIKYEAKVWRRQEEEEEDIIIVFPPLEMNRWGKAP